MIQVRIDSTMAHHVGIFTLSRYNLWTATKEPPNRRLFRCLAWGGSCASECVKWVSPAIGEGVRTRKRFDSPVIDDNSSL